MGDILEAMEKSSKEFWHKRTTQSGTKPLPMIVIINKETMVSASNKKTSVDGVYKPYCLARENFSSKETMISTLKRNDKRWTGILTFYSIMKGSRVTKSMTKAQ